MDGKPSPLREELERWSSDSGLSLDDLTVLAKQNDPFRLDTPANHRDGKWLRDTADALGLGDRTIHIRGLHYMVIGETKPDGDLYENDDPTWVWLQSKAAKAARWLQYIPFDQIEDERNAKPIVRLWTRPEPKIEIDTGIFVMVPQDTTPSIELIEFDGVQRYKLVMFGEKSSLDDVLSPIAEDLHADLYLMTGEISDTYIYLMAKNAAADGRTMIVFIFCDADPAGWQMAISIGRKLQALRILEFPQLKYQVRRVALTPDQVREYRLPSTPLKETEKRADKWREKMRVEQTEIDALAALRPDLLDRIARDAMAPFFDPTLEERLEAAQQEWLRGAHVVIHETLGAEGWGRRAEAVTRLHDLRDEINEIDQALQLDPQDFDFPSWGRPRPRLSRMNGTPLIDSQWSFVTQTRGLIDSKAYRINTYRPGLDIGVSGRVSADREPSVDAHKTNGKRTFKRVRSED
jgi:hypothetical protein